MKLIKHLCFLVRSKTRVQEGYAARTAPLRAMKGTGNSLNLYAFEDGFRYGFGDVSYFVTFSETDFDTVSETEYYMVPEQGCQMFSNNLTQISNSVNFQIQISNSFETAQIFPNSIKNSNNFK